MRDVRKGDGWAQRGCELATADILDVAALASAFEGAEGVFVLVPPNFDPAPSFPEARATAATLKSAIERDRKSTRLNSSHGYISYAVFCLKKKKRENQVRSPHEHHCEIASLQTLSPTVAL